MDSISAEVDDSKKQGLMTVDELRMDIVNKLEAFKESLERDGEDRSRDAAASMTQVLDGSVESLG